MVRNTGCGGVAAGEFFSPPLHRKVAVGREVDTTSRACLVPPPGRDFALLGVASFVVAIAPVSYRS